MNNSIKPKRKIGEIEELYDLERSFANINKKTKIEPEYTLKIAGTSLFLGKFNTKLNLNHIAEFIDIKSDVVTYIESKEFTRSDNDKCILKTHINPTFTYLKLHVSLITHEVRLQLFSNGMFLIKHCNKLSEAESAIEKLLFEINTSKHKHLFYL